jgi:hypothetical protein
LVRRNGIRTIDSEKRDFVQACQCKMKFKNDVEKNVWSAL